MKKQLTVGVWLLLVFGGASSERATVPYFGIPVPGQTVKALDVLQYYSDSCRPRTSTVSGAGDAAIYREIANVLRSTRSEQIAQQLYNSLYFAVGNVQVERMMGRWFRVLDSPSAHPEKCVVSYYEMLSNGDYLSTFATKDYYRNGDSTQTTEGYGTKTGPDPANFHIHTGHPADPCPYTVVKTGPLDKDGNYEYVLLSQLMKHPLIGLARDPKNFEIYHKADVEEFLTTHNFQNPLRRTNGRNSAYSMVTYVDFDKCPRQYYFDL